MINIGEFLPVLYQIPEIIVKIIIKKEKVASGMK